MKRYVNGKLYEITKEERENSNSFFKRLPRNKKNSDSESRIKDLENTIKELSEKLEQLQK